MSTSAVSSALPFTPYTAGISIVRNPELPVTLKQILAFSRAHTSSSPASLAQSASTMRPSPRVSTMFCSARILSAFG
ncbi:hypothetical protein [Streptomyces sp. NBC_00885]|uniref:hypothetical protein n=1 Tax=unclassified Streptomyces TaxID=2593676 RepID=UPI003869E701